MTPSGRPQVWGLDVCVPRTRSRYGAACWCHTYGARAKAAESFRQLRSRKQWWGIDSAAELTAKPRRRLCFGSPIQALTALSGIKTDWRSRRV